MTLYIQVMAVQQPLSRFVREEYPRLEEAKGKCQKLTDTLETLKQVAAVQFHRTPLVPYFPPTPNPNRLALMENIRAVAPNHAHRVESIEMAECVQHRKKELVMRREGIKRFESQLRIQRELLHKMDSRSSLEDRQAKKMIALYMEEKAGREAELAREIKLERKVAERKRKEERERVKERLQRQREEEKRRTRVEQLRGRGEIDQVSTQSSVGEEGGGEWYHGDGEEESIHFSSSFSSTASLLEHVRSMNGWSSDNTSLQDKGVEEHHKSQGDLPPRRALERKQRLSEERKTESHHTGSAHDDSSTVEEGSVSGRRKTRTRLESKPAHSQSSGESSRLSEPHTSESHKSLKPPKKVKSELRQPQTSSHRQRRDKLQSLPKEGTTTRSKYEPTQTKPHQKRLNNETRSGLQSPTNGVQSIFKVNHTQGLPQKKTNHTRATKKGAQPARQAMVQPTATRFTRKRVPLNDVTTSSATRRVASSESLLDEPRPQQNHSGPTHRPISTATKLADMPTKIRKSIGYMGEFKDQAGIYDLLEKKPAQGNTRQQKRRDVRSDKGFQTPTFDPQVREQEGDLQGATERPVTSNSQPDNFDFISNPSYERRVARATHKNRETAKESEVRHTSHGRGGKPGANSDQNGPMNNTGGVRQSYVPTSKMAKSVVINPGAPQSLRGQAVINTGAPQSLRGQAVIDPGAPQSLRGQQVKGWHNSESDSSETDRVRSGLSDHSSTTRHSVMSGHHSHSSRGFSSSGHSEAPPISHTLHSHVTSRPPPQSMMIQSGSEEPRSHSGLPVPRKRYQTETGRGGGSSMLAPHPPPNRGTTKVPMQTVHDEGALTSYPRFQRREDHQARLQGGTQSARSPRHRTRQLGVLPGTGQLAQVSKPRPDHAHPLKNSRHPGSLV